jgi:poly(hydroxyalkanoate) granule-associated protein
MSEKVNEDLFEEEVEEEGGPFFDMARRILLASIGAVVIAQEEIEDFINKLVERGELAEKDGKKLFGEMVDKRKKATKDAESEANKRMTDILNQMNVPSKQDVNDLSKKIAELSEKVDELSDTQK